MSRANGRGRPMVQGARYWKTVSEEPDRCQCDNGRCGGRGIGWVVFQGQGAVDNGLPIAVPLAICEKHWTSFAAVRAEQDAMRERGWRGQGIIRTLERYKD